jgi:hypothetical protein
MEDNIFKRGLFDQKIIDFLKEKYPNGTEEELDILNAWKEIHSLEESQENRVIAHYGRQLKGNAR